MTRHTLTLDRQNRAKAHVGIDRAPYGWILELRAPTRSDEQNRALWELIGQIQKQRPMHNGIRMDKDKWKAVFMDALGIEMAMLPSLEGDKFIPYGNRSSKLTVGEFSDLITIILAWSAREGLVIEHFDELPSPTARALPAPNKAGREAVSA
jgi:hypothetical protein